MEAQFVDKVQRSAQARTFRTLFVRRHGSLHAVDKLVMYDGNRLHEEYGSSAKVLILESESCCAKRPALLCDALE